MLIMHLHNKATGEEFLMETLILLLFLEFYENS